MDKMQNDPKVASSSEKSDENFSNYFFKTKKNAL